MFLSSTSLKKSAVLLLAVTLFCSFGIFKKKKVQSMQYSAFIYVSTHSP